MIVTTTDLENVKEVKGLVCGEVVMGNSAAKDFKASIKAFTGGRATGYEEGLRDARKEAVAAMTAEAEALSADAIVGVSIDYEIIADGSMVVANALGTAVTLK